MPFIKLKLTKFKLDKGKFTKALDTAIKLQMKIAARLFFKAASEAVPVRTGFARGSLSNIADATGIAGKVSPAERYLRTIKKIRGAPFNEYYYFGKRRILKTPEAGRLFSTKTENVFKVVGTIYSFNFAVSIIYYNINDLFTNPRTPSAPWQSFEKGRLAFTSYMNTTGRTKFPKVTDFVIKEKFDG